MRTKTEMLQSLVEEYRDSGEEWPATTKQIAMWAIRSRRWQPPTKNLVTQCASEIAAAMRQEFYADPQGRRVRAKHPYVVMGELSDGTYEQLYLWIDVHDDTARPREIEMAFQYGRKLIVGDCRQLKTDVDSYNDNNKHGHYVEVDFDFTPDLEEAAQATVYPGLS
jgi:hypothetical protein